MQTASHPVRAVRIPTSRPRSQKAKAPHRVTTLDKLRAHPRVECVDDERALGHSLLVCLKAGWTFDLSYDNRVQGADTVKEALRMVRQDAKPTIVPLTN